jgi:hypothetical protein
MRAEFEHVMTLLHSRLLSICSGTCPRSVARKAPCPTNTKQRSLEGAQKERPSSDYLEALRANKPRRGRKRTSESITKRLDAIDAELVDADPLDELKLVEERRRLHEERASMQASVDLSALEAAFVEVAKGYSERQGISYASWREVGVERRRAEEGRHQPIRLTARSATRRPDHLAGQSRRVEGVEDVVEVAERSLQVERLVEHLGRPPWRRCRGRPRAAHGSYGPRPRPPSRCAARCGTRRRVTCPAAPARAAPAG